jgi:hypothetical protein
MTEPPTPFRFNLWKHHAGAIRGRIASATAAELAALPAELVVIGTDLMDLYHGGLSPAEIGERVLAQLRDAGVDRPETFRPWIDANSGYRMVELADDGSRWALRAGDSAERFVHVHPGRWSPMTVRVRANVLKTAVMTLAHVNVHGGDPFDVGLINRVRADHLGFAPLRRVTPDEGLGLVIDFLRGGS